MQLQVELSGPDRRVGVLRSCGGEEGVRVLDRDLRRAFEVAQPPGLLHHLAGGTAPAVSVAERQQRAGTAALVGVVAHRVGQLGAGERAVVGVGGREVREDPGAVDALPPERVVGKPVRLVPGDLLGQEPLVAGQYGELRVRRGVAEGVRQPHAAGLGTELLEEEPLAVDELARQGLAAGEVAVGLHPHAADGRPLARLHRLGDAAEDLRVTVLHPGVLLRLRAGEHQLGVVLGERGDVGEGPRGLALGLAYGPQPGAVDVRVAGGGDGVRAGVRGP